MSGKRSVVTDISVDLAVDYLPVHFVTQILTFNILQTRAYRRFRGFDQMVGDCKSIRLALEWFVPSTKGRSCCTNLPEV